jgi:hypothetical protein
MSETFNYQYSASQNKEVEIIRKRYLPKEETKLDRLHGLDKKVRGAGVIPSLCVGIVGALLFGVGMCFGLGALSGAAFLKSAQHCCAGRSFRQWQKCNCPSASGTLRQL